MVVTLTDGRVVRGSHCLLTVGMEPSVSGIGLAGAGVKRNGDVPLPCLDSNTTAARLQNLSISRGRRRTTASRAHSKVLTQVLASLLLYCTDHILVSGVTGSKQSKIEESGG